MCNTYKHCATTVRPSLEAWTPRGQRACHCEVHVLLCSLGALTRLRIAEAGYPSQRSSVAFPFKMGTLQNRATCLTGSMFKHNESVRASANLSGFLFV